MKAQTVFLLVVIPIAMGMDQVQVQDKCSWGESYWCSNIRIAKQCGAVDHCKATIWKNQVLLDNNADDVCNFCKGIVTDVRDFLKNKDTQDQIKQYIESACSVLPEPSISDECKEIVNTFFPEFIDLVESELDPVAICSAFGICSGFKDKVQHFDVIKKPSVPRIPILLGGKPLTIVDGDVCTDCKTLVQDIKDQMTSDATEKQVEELFKQNVCSRLGGMEKQCEEMVDTYTPELMQLLSSSVDPAVVCQAIGLCAGGDRTILPKMKFMKSTFYQKALKTNDEVCDICKLAITEVMDFLDDPQDVKEIEDFTKNTLCAALGSLAEECKTAVDDYGPIVLALIKEELSDPESACQMLGMCSAESRNSAVRHNTVLKKSPNKSMVKASSQCVLCEFVVTELRQLLGDNATESEIIAGVEKVCTVLPDTIKEECTMFVKQYGDAVIKLLVSELSPEMVCQTLGLCQSKKDVPINDSELCGVCETVLQYIDSLLAENSTQTEIDQLMDKVCNFLPDSLKSQCTDFINMYGPMIVNEVAHALDPQKVCATLGLCGARAKSTPMVKVVPMVDIIVPQKANMLGENECTYGPAFWCASKENANKCNAVEHCQKHVWNK